MLTYYDSPFKDQTEAIKILEKNISHLFPLCLNTYFMDLQLV